MLATTSRTPTMVWIPGGSFVMGSDDHYPDEAPAHPVHVDGFWIDRTPVTNRMFADFVAATGYQTDAERVPSPEQYRGIPAHRLLAGSAVFTPPDGPVDLSVPTWWSYVPGAAWHSPEGPHSSIDDRLDHPVVHVSRRDAAAYARWCGKRLPTEAEWERAARGGVDGREYAWGAEARPGGRELANIWGAEFPSRRDCDRPPGTTPVGEFPANGYGLLDMIGNVWEWTTDSYQPGHTPVSPCCASTRSNPLTPPEDPLALGGALRVAKGGSFLCADNYCHRYRPAARIPQADDSAASNLGFRCVATSRPEGTR